jgi:hypothetical protein
MVEASMHFTRINTSSYASLFCKDCYSCIVVFIMTKNLSYFFFEVFLVLLLNRRFHKGAPKSKKGRRCAREPLFPSPALIHTQIVEGLWSRSKYFIKKGISRENNPHVLYSFYKNTQFLSEKNHLI